MEEEMRELYAEGPATHGDPESCVDDPRGRGEALTGARVGRAIEPRNQGVRGADAVVVAEGHTGGSVTASCCWTPRGRRTMACTEPPCTRTGRSRLLPIRLITGWAAQGTPMAVRLG